MGIEDNLKLAEEFKKKAEQAINDGEENNTIYCGNNFNQASSYLNLALYHQNKLIIDLLKKINYKINPNN